MIQLNQLTVYAAKEILKWVGKSYLGYIGVGIMLWDFTDCMSHF
jgi:threonine/homoserine/homoserine lactone efflux protein